MTDIETSETVAGAQERWLPVVGYEGSYEVSDHGRVRSVERIIVQETRWGGSSQRHMKGFILTPGDNGRGYMSVILGSKGSKNTAKRFYVHILVLAAFVGPMPEGMETAHGDGKRGNNQLGNLRYATSLENDADKKKHGTYHVGEAKVSAKLTSKQVIEIRSFPSSVTSAEIGKIFGMSGDHIYCIRTRRSWAHLS